MAVMRERRIEFRTHSPNRRNDHPMRLFGTDQPLLDQVQQRRIHRLKQQSVSKVARIVARHRQHDQARTRVHFTAPMHQE